MYQDERKTTLNGQKSSIFLKRLAIEFDRRGKLKIGERRPTIFSESDKLARVPGYSIVGMQQQTYEEPAVHTWTQVVL